MVDTKRYVIKTFKTPNSFYVFDRSTNSVTVITDDEYKELHRAEVCDDNYDEFARRCGCGGCAVGAKGRRT